MEIVVSAIAVILAVSCLFFVTRSDLVDRLREKFLSAEQPNKKSTEKTASKD